MERFAAVLLPFSAAPVSLLSVRSILSNAVAIAGVSQHPVHRRPAASGAVCAAQAARHVVRFDGDELFHKAIHLALSHVVPDTHAEHHGEHHDEHERTQDATVQRRGEPVHECSGTNR